jgi:molybdate transport system substrate-binding protein
MERLGRSGFLKEGSMEVYAVGRVAIIVKEDSTVSVSTLTDLLAPEIKRIAIANPAHAPYGAAALRALRSAGLFELLKGRLVYAENVRQALNFVETGDAQAGIVALSVVVEQGPGDGERMSYFIIPERLHGPVNQAVAIVESSSDSKAAADFIRYVKSPGGRAVLERYGFLRLQGE